MKIIKWDKYNNEKYSQFDNTKEEAEAERIIIEEIKRNGYLFSGTYHQQGEKGAPVFDNGKQFATTFRSWGSIMEEAYPDIIDDYSVMAYDLHCAHLKHLLKYPQ